MLNKKTAIITGGSRGIGLAIAEKYAQNGASLILAAQHRENLESARETIIKNHPDSSSRIEILHGDIAQPEYADQLVQLAIGKFGTIDILVNCAGTITRTPFEDLGIEEWQRVLDVNLNGTFYMSKAVLPEMKKTGTGKIINITSQMAKIPHPSASPSYEVSKAGMSALTRHLSFHLAKYNICVNAIAPGSIDTDLPKSMSFEMRQKLKDAVPLQRLGEPSEVGDLAVFLASNMSDYITGATINISGGSLMD